MSNTKTKTKDELEQEHKKEKAKNYYFGLFLGSFITSAVLIGVLAIFGKEAVMSNFGIMPITSLLLAMLVVPKTDRQKEKHEQKYDSLIRNNL